MVRTGIVLSYQVQEGDPEFREIATYEIGLADVISVQALCGTGWQPAGVGIRFSRLDLHASKGGGGAIAVEAGPGGPGAPNATSRGRKALWIALALGTLFSLAAIAGVAVFLWKRGPKALAKTHPTAAATQQSVVFPCPDCGKKLKVKSALAGKRIKCPHCGEKIPVAATSQVAK